MRCIHRGTKMSQLMNGRWIIEDMRRGRWSSEQRERIIQETAVQDGTKTVIWLEQEPGVVARKGLRAAYVTGGIFGYAERPQVTRLQG